MAGTSRSRKPRAIAAPTRASRRCAAWVAGWLCCLSAWSLPAIAEGSDPVRRIGIAPVLVSGQTAPHIDTHFAERVRMAMQAEGFELVDLSEHWPEDCEADPCRADAADAARVEYMVVARVHTEERDYDMRIGLYNASGMQLRQADASCEICTYAEAAEKLGFEVAAFRGRLFAGSDVLEPEPARRTVAVPMDGEGGVGKLDERQATLTAASLLGGSLALIAGGATMIALEEKNFGPRCSATNIDPAGNCEFRHQTLEGGIALTALGVGAAIGGATLLGLNAKSRSDKVSVRVVPSLTSVRVEGRF